MSNSCCGRTDLRGRTDGRSEASVAKSSQKAGGGDGAIGATGVGWRGEALRLFQSKSPLMGFLSQSIPDKESINTSTHASSPMTTHDTFMKMPS